MGGYINLAVGQDYIRTLWYVWTQTYFGHPFSEITIVIKELHHGVLKTITRGCSLRSCDTFRLGIKLLLVLNQFYLAMTLKIGKI